MARVGTDTDPKFNLSVVTHRETQGVFWMPRSDQELSEVAVLGVGFHVSYCSCRLS